MEEKNLKFHGEDKKPSLTSNELSLVNHNTEYFNREVTHMWLQVSRLKIYKFV